MKLTFTLVLSATFIIYVLLLLNPFLRFQFRKTINLVQAVEKSLPYVWEKIPAGSSKKEVENFLGAPHNTDSDSVWVWVNPANNGSMQEWRDLVPSPKGGYFIIFSNDISITPPLSFSSFHPDDFNEDGVKNKFQKK